jgi:hypothetical protein
MIRTELKFTAFSLFVLAISAFVFTQFLFYHEISSNANGIIINDPLFHWLPLHDHSVLIFSVTYGSILVYFALNFKNPGFASRAILSYAFILLLRIPTLTIIPLKVHPDLIFLADPFLNDLIYPSRITNDLFFSGHVALLCIFAQLSRFRWVFIFTTILLALLLLIQRVHYSIDVIGAIPFAFLAVRLSDLLRYKMGMKRID